MYLPEREKMQDWATVIPAASENYVPCTQDTPNISEVNSMDISYNSLNRIVNNRLYIVT